MFLQHASKANCNITVEICLQKLTTHVQAETKFMKCSLPSPFYWIQGKAEGKPRWGLLKYNPAAAYFSVQRDGQEKNPPVGLASS